MQVLPFEIPKTGNSAILYQVDQGESFYGRLHRHKEIQISLILQGRGDMVIADSLNTFEPGELYFIGSNTPHLFRAFEQEENVHMVSVFFTLDSLGRGFFESDEMKSVLEFIQSVRTAVRFQSIHASLAAQFQSLELKKSVTKITTFLLFTEAISKMKAEHLSELPAANLSIREGERMRNVMDFALRNYTKNVKLEEFASIAHMTPNAFCRYFKMRTKKSVFQFVHELRMAHADRLLLQGETTILEVAYASGFRNISHFNRTFLKYHGCSPTLFRKNKKP